MVTVAIRRQILFEGEGGFERSSVSTSAFSSSEHGESSSSSSLEDRGGGSVDTEREERSSISVSLV